MKKELKKVTLKKLKDEIILFPETELEKQYNKKELNRNESIESKLTFNGGDGNFGEHIGSPHLSSGDFTDNYGLAFFNLTHDPNYNGGLNGCAYTSQMQIVDLNKNLSKLLTQSFNYRGTGNSPFNHRMNFSEGKILKETKDTLQYGIKSHKVLEFYEFNTKTNEKKLIESIDLGYTRKNKEKLEKFDKAFKELDTGAIKDFLGEENYFTKVKKINDDYALVMLEDPYGDTGSRHAKTKLVIKNNGMIDLEYHDKKFIGDCVTQGFEIEDISMNLQGEKINLEYKIKETQSDLRVGNHGETLGITSYSINLDPKKLNIPTKISGTK